MQGRVAARIEEAFFTPATVVVGSAIVGLFVWGVLFVPRLPVFLALAGPGAVLLTLLCAFRPALGVYVLAACSAIGALVFADLPDVPPIYPVQLCLFALLVAAVARRLSIGEEVRLPRGLLVPMSAFLVWGAICLLVNTMQEGPSEFALKIRLNGFMIIFLAMASFYVAARYVRSRAAAAGFVAAVFLSVVPVAGIQLHHFWQAGFQFGYDTRTFSSIGGNFLGAYYVVIATLAFSLMLTAERMLLRLLFLGLLGFAVLCLAVTFARASLVCAAAAIWTVVIVEKRRLILPLLIGTVIAVLSPAFFRWTTETFALFDIWKQSGTWDRIPIAMDAVKIWLEHPLFGIGFGPYGRFSEVFVWYAHFGSWGYVNSAHNDFLQVLADVGLLGLALYVWMLVAMGREARKALAGTADWFRRALAVSFAGVLVAVIAGNFASELVLGTANNGDYLNLSARIYYWMFLGVIVAMNTLPSRQWRRPQA
ncbi:MAG: O-antigen ligase family protein [Candidatus Eisenbacteria bacterium]